jgi:hypothetical protein
MSVVIRSLIGLAQTLDSVVLNPYAAQTRNGSTAALVAAVAAKTIQMDVIDAQADPSGGKSVYYVAPLTGATVTPDVGTEVALIVPAGTIAALTLNMPASPYDGQEFTASFDQIVTALTMAAPASATLKGALTAATAKGFAKWMYNKADTSWYRIG